MTVALGGAESSSLSISQTAIFFVSNSACLYKIDLMHTSRTHPFIPRPVHLEFLYCAMVLPTSLLFFQCDESSPVLH